MSLVFTDPSRTNNMHDEPGFRTSLWLAKSENLTAKLQFLEVGNKPLQLPHKTKVLEAQLLIACNLKW